MHLTNIDDHGDGESLDINTAGAGQGNAVCAECHFELHSTRFAPWADNQDYSRGVNFAPNVQPLSGEIVPAWSVSNRTCSLVCHGETHDQEDYGPGGH